MKSGKLLTIIVPILAVIATGIAVVLFWPKTETIPDRSFVPTEIRTRTPDVGSRVFLASDRVPSEPDQIPVTKGFVDHVTLVGGVLEFKGWAPMNTGSTEGRLIIRDPFGFVEPSGDANLTPIERTDVATGHPNEPELLNSGFSLTLPITQSIDHREWLNSLEIYADAPDGTLYRLSRINQIRQSGWAKQSGMVEIALVYSNPPYSKTEKKEGYLDVVVQVDERGTVELQGWAPLNLRSPESRLCLRLPPKAAPVSILEYTVIERPDVAEAHADKGVDLRYSGFKIVLATRGFADALLKDNAIQIWSIDGENQVTALKSPRR